MDFVAERARMVETQLVSRGIVDRRVLAAMREVPREAFLPAGQAEHAYEDGPLPIGQGQTMSQPFIVALMAEAARLRGDERVLEIGTGSGYGAAVLARLAAEVVTIERHAALAEEARRSLALAGVDNVSVVHGDGTLGLPERAPYQAIVVTASGPTVPPALTEQLDVGGRLLIPIEFPDGEQHLVLVRRLSPSRLEERVLDPVRFVPLIGAAGWRPVQGEESVPD